MTLTVNTVSYTAILSPVYHC